ncbi:vancomycin resistance protein [Paenibacillus sambharensis]|uniref:Vancomycin resistance protein n=1 Tax=Paenibacillus sambharensis TaxID=1803190 RepID=A0A2W1LN58_9BACL|nr:VanW family protein [Paenibacillus sambharensis]PZD96325.1 vancomycin resistance protein [Paenibacillus sambharensis]
MSALKPVKRSVLRLTLGKWFYRTRRYASWYWPGKRYADKPALHAGRLPYTIFTHRTPTLRKLKDVDMWLQHNKVHNLKLACSKLDGVIIRPGETLSYWRTIGNPSKRRGYVEGMVLYFGTFKPGYGGGLCQLSNLIYWMTLHSPLTVTERHRHSYDVFPDANRKLPFGSGATCAYNYLDLQICNTTEACYQLCLRVADNELVGSWRSDAVPVHTYKVYEKAHRMQAEPWGAYTRHNEIWRHVYNMDAGLVKDEYITENHALMMYEPLLAEAAGPAADVQQA